jgi:hypothetical protein
MATTSIWHVKGYLGQVLIYAENPEKTENPKFYEMEGDSAEDVQGLGDVMAYATSPSKTEQRLFVYGINCDTATARTEMMAIKRGFSKVDGIVAWHGYQSFKPGEVTPEIAHEIGIELAQRMWGDLFQVVVATHLDRGHLHNHFVLNSVSMVDGRRWYRKAEQYRLLRETSDALCREYGLSVIKNPKRGKSKHYAEWQAETNDKPTWRNTIASDVDECIARAKTKRQFFKNLETLGYEYKEGKDISVRPPDKERFFRLARNLGDEYTIKAICERIEKGAHHRQVLPVPKYRHPDFTPPKKMPKWARGSIVSLHRRYLYLFGYYQQRGRPTTNARMHYLLREDIRKLDHYIADTRLLGREDIHTSEQLRTFEDSCQTKIDDLIKARKELKAEIRQAAGKGNPYTTKANPRYQQINTRLKTLRKEVNQCDRIKERSRTLADRIQRIERDEDKKISRPGKEVGRGRDRASDRSDDAHHTDRR